MTQVDIGAEMTRRDEHEGHDGNANQLSRAASAEAGSAVPFAMLRKAREVRQHFDDCGVSIADWAQQRGFSVALTRAILSGKRRCVRGQSHHIAVALGIKRIANDHDQSSLFANESHKEDPMTS